MAYPHLHLLYFFSNIVVPTSWYNRAMNLRGDCKPYPHNVKLVNFEEHFSQKLLDLDM